MGTTVGNRLLRISGTRSGDVERLHYLKQGYVYQSRSFFDIGRGDEVLLTDTNGVMYELKKKVIVPFERIK